MGARQFDVFSNPDPETSDSHPYLVVLQSDALGDFNTRIVAPLIAPRQVPMFEKLMPEVVVRGSHYVIDVTVLGPVSARLLQKPITNLAAERYHILRGIDLVFTGV